jgi:hypothetical protein
VEAYRQYIERDAAMQRRFCEVLSPELSRYLGRDGVSYQIVERERYTAERRLASKEDVMAHAGGRPLTVDWHEDADTVRQA